MSAIKEALRMLLQLSCISSCTACGAVAIIAEERRRQTNLVSKIAENPHRLKHHPRYQHAPAVHPTANEVPLSLVNAAEQAKPDRRLIVRDRVDWLSLLSNQQWLVIIDNVDREHTTEEKDPLAYDVTQYLPLADHGSILITSRLSSLTGPRKSLRLTEVDHDQSRAILEAAGGDNVSGMMSALGSRLTGWLMMNA